MTKKEFDTTNEPLAMIVSLNPNTGETFYDTYYWNSVEGVMKSFEKDFPDMIHFFKYNAVAIERKKQYFTGAIGLMKF